MLYRSDEGKYDLNFEPLDLNLITEEVVNEYKNISIEEGLHHLPPDLLCHILPL